MFPALDSQVQIGHGVCLHPDVPTVLIVPKGQLSWGGDLPVLFEVPFQTHSSVDSATQSSDGRPREPAQLHTDPVFFQL